MLDNVDNPRYNIGGFKVVPNIIGIVNAIKTSEPKDVEKISMSYLLII